MSDEDLPPGRADTLLRLGLSRPRRGVDGVVERMSAWDGPAWFNETLGALPAADAAAAADALVRGGAGPEDLRALKERHKAAMLAPGPAGERLRSVLLYYLCIAGAWLHYARLLTGQPRESVADALVDLAGAAPEPWSSFLGRAAASLHEGLE